MLEKNKFPLFVKAVMLDLDSVEKKVEIQFEAGFLVRRVSGGLVVGLADLLVVLLLGLMLSLC